MSILSDVMDGILFVDADDRVGLINPVAEALLETKAFQAVGHRFQEISPGCADLARAVLEDHARVVELDEITRTVEVQSDALDLTYVRISTSQVYDYERHPAGILTVLQDITSEYKSDQLRNQYLSIVAHELRTPLTGIKTFSTLMSSGRMGELTERQMQAVNSIREQSIRLEHQIDKLINLGNIDANQYAQDPEVLVVADLVEAAVAPFEQVAADAGVNIVVANNSPPNSHIRADRTDIKRVLKSLIENAVKFTPSPGTVTMSSEIADGMVQFAVTDTGIGITRRYHRRIFEKFFQVEDPLTRHHGGAGLGLFVAQGIIEAHGSRIEVLSDLGCGASFRFALPLFEVEIDAVSNATEPASTSS